LKIFYLDKSFIFFLFVIVICGLFNNFFIYFILLIIHELGHAITGIILGYKLDKIKIYPYGGVTQFQPAYNAPLKKELIVLVMGPVFQIIGYFFMKSFINYDYLEIYHYTLLIFNLLPIYPLDGGKLLNIFLNYYFNYKRSFHLSFCLSIVIIVLLSIYGFIIMNFNFLLILVILLIKLFKNYKNLNYMYNNFLLDRYLHHYKFKNTKCICNENSFFRDREHIIKIVPERKFLQNYFKK